MIKVMFVESKVSQELITFPYIKVYIFYRSNVRFLRGKDKNCADKNGVIILNIFL